MKSNQNKKVITPDEFHQYLEENLDVRDPESILACTPMLEALANNRDFLIKTVNEDIKDMQLQRKINPYSAPTFGISMGKNFMVRANIWSLESSHEKRKSFEKDILVYGLAHDHNFDFLTIGYHGSGYATEMYEYDYDKVQGYVGEPVDLVFKELTKLPRGKVMFYRQSKDVHRQLPPDELSVSLNLLTSTPEGEKRNQYIFDLEKKQIMGFTQMNISSRIFLFDLAKALGNENSVDAISSLSQKSESARIRAAAIEALIDIKPDETNWFMQNATQDKHPLVRTAEGRTLLMKGL